MPFCKFKSTAVLLFVFAMVAVAGLLFSEQLPTYSKDVNVVNILATVRDKHGKIVNDLTQSDFVLEEDGRPQVIRYFSRETDLPLTLGLLVDTSLSQRRVLDQERSASGSFVDQVLREDKDKAFLIHFDREVELLQDLTPSRQQLKSALNLLQTPQRDQSSNSGNPGDQGGYPGSGQGGAGGPRFHHGESTLLYDSIYLASDELMQKQEGRKAVVVLSDGVDRGSKKSIDRAIASAQRANTVVYSILYEDRQDHGNNGGWGRGGMGGGMGGPWGRPGGYPRYPQPEQERPDGKKVLERISNETGGHMFEVSKKETVDEIYQQIQDELRNQYNLGYTPDSAAGSSDYHKIHLATTRHDLSVQARDGYYSSKPVDGKGK